MGDRLKSQLGGNRAGSPYFELVSEHLAKLIGRNEFVLRDFFYQSGYGCRTRQQHLAWATKKFEAFVGNVDDLIFWGAIFFSASQLADLGM